MKRLVFAVLGVTLYGCGPSLESDRPKTPDEIVAEEEAKGAEAQKKARNAGDYAEPSGATEEEKKRQWDDAYAALELRRAARSAETCPESVTEKVQKGKAKVSLRYENDGRSKDATIDAPYTDTAVGKCVLRAMGAAIVKPFEGPPHSVQYEVDLTGGKKSGPLEGIKLEDEKEKGGEE
ncbi:MAG: hypothetical protein ACOY0T_19330 [Myxococcota bacterium]